MVCTSQAALGNMSPFYLYATHNAAVADHSRPKEGHGAEPYHAELVVRKKVAFQYIKGCPVLELISLCTQQPSKVKKIKKKKVGWVGCE